MHIQHQASHKGKGLREKTHSVSIERGAHEIIEGAQEALNALDDLKEGAHGALDDFRYDMESIADGVTGTIHQVGEELKTLEVEKRGHAIKETKKEIKKVAAEEVERIEAFIESFHTFHRHRVIQNWRDKVRARPKLERAALHRKYRSLPRRKRDEEGNYYLCRPGEVDGELCTMCTCGAENTTAKQGIFSIFDIEELSMFGPGVALYFYLRLSLGICFIIVAVIYTPTILYYASDAYSDGQGGIDIRVKGSAVCTRSEEVTLIDGTTGLRKDCELAPLQGYTELAATAVFMMFVLFFKFHIKRTIDRIDLARQTGQDYTVVVSNPNFTIQDPDEWHKFFSQFGPVAIVTVALDNGDLLKSLAYRRWIKDQIKLEINQFGYRPEGYVLNTIETLVNWLPAPIQYIAQQYLGIGRDLKFFQALALINDAVLQTQYQQTYNVTRVYCTFQREIDQHACIDAMESYTKANVPLQYKGFAHLFQDSQLPTFEPNVQEAMEPDDIIWQNLGHKNLITWLKTKAFIVFTLAALLAVSAVVAGIISESKQALDSALAPGWTTNDVLKIIRPRQVIALVISFFDMLYPALMGLVLYYIDNPSSHSERETSLVWAISLCRVANSAFIIYCMTSFEDTLSQEFLLQVQAILIAEAVLEPVIHVMDIQGLVNRNILAPMARTQNKMDVLFEGEHVELGKTYSGITTFWFTALLYMPVLPSALYITLLSFLLNYLVDKYSLMHHWHTMPSMNETMAKGCRTQLFFAIFAHVYAAGRFYAGWAYDNVCAVTDDDAITAALNSSFLNSTDVFVDGGTQLVYEKCNKQSGVISRVRDWMPDPQRFLVEGTNWCLLSVGITMAWVLRKGLIRMIWKKKGEYSDPTEKKFLSVPGILAYTPLYSETGMHHSLLACDHSQFDVHFVPFSSGGGEGGENTQGEEGFVRDNSLYMDVMGDLSVVAIGDSDSGLPQYGKRTFTRAQRLFSTCRQYPVDLPADEARAQAREILLRSKLAAKAKANQLREKQYHKLAVNMHKRIHGKEVDNAVKRVTFEERQSSSLLLLADSSPAPAAAPAPVPVPPQAQQAQHTREQDMQLDVHRVSIYSHTPEEIDRAIKLQKNTRHVKILI